MGLGDFLTSGVQKLGNAVSSVSHEATRLGKAVVHETKRVATNVVDTAKDVVEIGKVVKDQVGNLISSGGTKDTSIDLSQFSASDLKKANDRGDEKHLTNQYNYAGPGTFFDARQKGSSYYEKLMRATGHKVKGTKPYNKPFNALDACAVKHDRVYANPKQTPTQVQAADRNFQTCIGNIKNPDRQEALLIKGAKVGFSAKSAAENVGIMKKGSLSDSDSKESTGSQLKRLAFSFLP
tara:strand:+ start:2509 stop:3219 length:711 start_codon:yes stop_codon:yes gene_type:complete